MTANNPYDIHVYFSTINDGWGPIHAKYVGHRPSPRFHSGVLGFTFGEVLAHEKFIGSPLLRTWLFVQRKTVLLLG